MPNDRPGNASVLSLIPGEGKPLSASAEQRRAFECGRAAAERDAIRAKYGGENYVPEPPIKLSAEAMKFWELGLKGVPMALRRPGIEDALVRYSLAMALLEKTTVELERNGLLARGRAGESVKSPLLSIRSTAMYQIREARNELGLPAAFRGKART